jgi:hypothetical protein
MDAIDKLAMQQQHDDMVELIAAVKELTETIKNKDDVGATGDAIPVKVVEIGEDALAVITQVVTGDSSD